jgi:hypothetical protein
MAFTTYTELQTEIIRAATRTGDAEFALLVPGFITQVEMTLNNGTETMAPLRTREMEVSGTVAVTSGTGPLPADYLEFIKVTNAAGDVLDPETTTGAERRYNTTAGVPKRFAIEGVSLRTFPASTETINLRYYGSLDTLAANETNWLLTRYPNIYLYGALVFAELAQENDQRASNYAQLFEQFVGGLTKSNNRSKYIRAQQRNRAYAP